MLPQKTVTSSFLKPIESLNQQENDSHEFEGQCATLVQTQDSAVPRAAQIESATLLLPSKSRLNAKMLPPALKSDPAKTGHFPKKSLNSRLPSQDRSVDGELSSQYLGDLSKPRPQARIGSTGSNSHLNIKESYHHRFSSQQVRPTKTPELLSSKGLPRRQSSMKTPGSTLSATQQHSFPKRSIQPEPQILLPAQSMGKDLIPSADIVHLQIEMAQLHLLHRSMLPLQVRWEKNARDSFEQRFNAIYERHTELREVAHQQQTLIDQLSLVQWSQSRSGAQIAEKVQLLSHNISDICNLLGLEGKYTVILESFESWFAQALEIRGQRESSGQKAGNDIDFIESIGDGWKAEAMVLERELTYSARDIESFQGIASTSSLFRVLSLYGKLVLGLLEELDLIQWIENEIMSIESSIHNPASNPIAEIDVIGLDQKAP